MAPEDRAETTDRLRRLVADVLHVREVGLTPPLDLPGADDRPIGLGEPPDANSPPQVNE